MPSLFDRGAPSQEVRVTLKEAGRMLGIAPNSVRSRYKTGKIRGERDNQGQIWVYLDPTSIEVRSNPSKGSKQESFELIQRLGYLESQLAARETELNTLRKEHDELRQKYDQARAAEAITNELRMQIQDLKAEHTSLIEQATAAERAMGELVGAKALIEELRQDRDFLREQLTAQEDPEPERRRRWWWFR